MSSDRSGRTAGSGRREQDIDVAKKRERLGAKPAPEFLRLRDPGAGKHGAGDQPVSDVGIEIAGARTQPFEMKRRAFDHRDEIGGRARHVGSGEFDDPIRIQRARNRVDRGKRARFGGAREIAAEPCDARPATPSSRVGDTGVAGTSACAGSCRHGQAWRHRRARDRRGNARAGPHGRGWRRTGIRRRGTTGHRSA